MPETYKPEVSFRDGKPVLNTDSQAESPTGVPAIPPKAVPWVVGFVGLAMVLAKTLPPHTVAAQVAGGVADVAVLLGLASPGWRK